jgi:hypothetical protein
VFDLLIVGVVVAVPVLYAADRIMKARAQGRRLRNMTERLTAATARTDEQQERRQEVAKASAALTSVMPAIKRPPLTLPGETADRETADGDTADGDTADGDTAHGDTAHGAAAHGPARPRTGCGRGAQQDHAHPRRPSRTDEHAVRSADLTAGR